MADKKVKIEVDLDVEPSIAQLKALKKQLKEPAAGSEEFTKIKNQINDVEDAIKSAKTGADNFAEIIGALPGPVGELGGKISGTVNVLKQFSGIKLDALKNSFTELGKDVGDVFKGFGQLTGLTKAYTTLNKGLASGLKAVGVGEVAAATGAKVLSAALSALGIGLIVAAVAALVDIISEFVSGEEEAKAAADKLNRTLESQNELFDLNRASADRAAKENIARMKANGSTEKQIRDQQTKDAYASYTAAHAQELVDSKTWNENYAKADADGKKKLQENLEKSQKATKDAWSAYVVTGYEARASDNKDAESKGKEQTAKSMLKILGYLR